MFKRLSTRFIVMTLLVMVVSSIIAFMLANVFYHFYEKEKNDARITEVLLSQKEFVETHDNLTADELFQEMANLDYQVVAIKDGEKKFYGTPFRKDNLSNETIDGEVYHGIKHRPFNILITGFFDNETKNTVGTNMEIAQETYSVFLRPNVGESMGEFRIFLAILLVLMILLSILFVALSSNLIVSPVIRLKQMAREIRHGNYKVNATTHRKDEIGTLHREMEHMSRSIKEQQDTNERFVANVSHEIQSPIANLLIQLEQLKETKDFSLIETMEHQSKRLSGLTKQLLFLASIEQSEHQLEKTFFQAKPFVKEIIQSHMYTLDRKEIFLITKVENTKIYGNSDLLFQALSNLLENAIKYTDYYGEITLAIKQENDQTLISVNDDGIGMKESTQRHLFERFYKDHSTEDEIPSNGLGMAIVKEIIDLHGGEITVHSKPHVGTQITIILPN